MKVTELLRDETTWCQGHYEDAHGRVCVEGAVLRCYSDSALQRQAVFTRLADALGGNTVEWNDAPERTFADVKALVEKLDI